MKKILSLVAVVGMSCWLAWAADAAKELDAAAQVVQNMASSNQIPSSLLNQAKCIAVIPKLTKAAAQRIVFLKISMMPTSSLSLRHVVVA